MFFVHEVETSLIFNTFEQTIHIMKTYKLLFLLLFSAVLSDLNAQTIDIGATAGASLYTGDMTKSPFTFDEMKPGGTIFGEYSFESKAGIRASFTYAPVSGDDLNKESSFRRNLNFENNIWEFSVVGTYDIIDEYFSDIVPYVYGGLGVFKHNPKTDYNGAEVELQPLGTEGQGIPGYGEKYSLTGLALPFGGGVKYSLNDQFNVHFDYGARWTSTKYLDDVGSEQYALPSALFENNGRIAYDLAYKMDEIEGGVPYAELENEATREAILRSSGEFNDWYHLFGVGVTYRLTDKNKSLIPKNRKGVPNRYSR